jgi:hypothetical protein
MDYESALFEADCWQGTVVLTEKATRRCGSIAMRNTKTRRNAAQMIAADVKKYGADRALATYAKLVENWT